jgi:tetratricopeptide (TPR) repeat protein
MAILALFFAYRFHLSETRWTDAKSAQLFETAQLAALEGDLKRAGAAINDAAQLGASEDELLLLRGQLDLQSGVFQDACDKLERAVALMPGSVAAHALLAKAYQSNEEHEKSARIAKALLALQPVTLQDYLLLGQAQSGSDFAMGLTTLDEAVQLNKTSVQARLTRGTLLAERAMDSGDNRTRAGDCRK